METNLTSNKSLLDWLDEKVELIEKQSKFPNFILINYTKKSLKFNRTAKNSLKCNNNIKSN